MTLVVGFKTSTGVHLLSDTRISHPDVTQVEEIPGRLKVVLLRADLCVAYAGRADYAIDTIRELAKTPDISVDDTIRYLLGVNQESKRNVDFLIASLHSEKQVLKVTEGRVAEDSDEAWIGSPDGAHFYEGHKSLVPVPLGADSESEALIRRLGAFRTVLGDTNVASVAGLQIRVVTRRSEFIYAPEGLAYFLLNQSPQAWRHRYGLVE